MRIRWYRIGRTFFVSGGLLAFSRGLAFGCLLLHAPVPSSMQAKQCSGREVWSVVGETSSNAFPHQSGGGGRSGEVVKGRFYRPNLSERSIPILHFPTLKYRGFLNSNIGFAVQSLLINGNEDAQCGHATWTKTDVQYITTYSNAYQFLRENHIGSCSKRLGGLPYLFLHRSKYLLLGVEQEVLT